MAQEAKRRCGYRKVGGLYLIGGKLPSMSCCKLPILLDVCPTCGGGVKQSRGWTWIDPRPWLQSDCTWHGRQRAPFCPASSPDMLGDRVGLLWIGAQFYPTPADFLAEAEAVGISRRITGVPRGFEVGKHWVFLAHPKVKQLINPENGSSVWLGGIFRIFKPSRIEKLITQSQAITAGVIDELERKGITPVIVPDDDKDHQGSVYDDDTEEPALPLAEPPAAHSHSAA